MIGGYAYFQSLVVLYIHIFCLWLCCTYTFSVSVCAVHTHFQSLVVLYIHISSLWLCCTYTFSVSVCAVHTHFQSLVVLYIHIFSLCLCCTYTFFSFSRGWQAVLLKEPRKSIRNVEANTKLREVSTTVDNVTPFVCYSITFSLRPT